ncbi:hypothetical protein K458DRAFT_400189 [Lentithecium fluviatile CBS 122367]|uniref:Geranylgeranyl transferase type II subunit alpha n=1 Tax=Lentithecium fluviatile CBS 122367 TaxID=1168545 RepID=A0A6G1JH21_9PLEO|nr:hypothetical protein K458DRAFT_400189 [Lentithecium fluviatile CBS 122367]
MASHGISRGAGPIVRTEEARQKELQQIAAYKDLSELVNTKIAERQYTIEVLGLVTTLLNENPEYYTVWNHRRRIMAALFATPAETNGSVPTPEQLVQDDLRLTFGLLRKFPKCYWIWNYRNWLLEAGETELGVEAGHKLWFGELLLVNKMLQADSRNFHAWSYRRIVVNQIERLDISDEGKAPQTLTESEFEYTTKMIKTNLSNFSAWHNRSKLIPRLLSERNADPKARRALLDSELALICEAINTDPFDQSIWFYHQYLMSTISPTCPSTDLIVVDLTNGERQKYYEHEFAYIKDILEDEADCKWIYEGLLYLAATFFIDTSSLAPIDVPSFFFHAHMPSKDASFDVFAVSVLSGSRSGAGGGIALEAIAIPIEMPAIVASAIGRIRPAIVLAHTHERRTRYRFRLTLTRRAMRAGFQRPTSPPTAPLQTICLRAPMSKWRLKGFVQDSDDEEEDLETTPPHSHRESQRAPNERVNEVSTNTEHTAEDREDKDGSTEFDGTEKGGGDEIASPANTTVRAPTRPTVSLITSFVDDPFDPPPTTYPLDITPEYGRSLSESSDPLQASPSPRTKRGEKLPSSSLSLGVPVSYQGTATSRRKETQLQPAADGILKELGLGPLSDASDSDVLSDPPSDMDEPMVQNTFFASPKRRTAVQVVIPRSTGAQEENVKKQVARSLRERKPIQLHPYALEGELYRRELQGRGIKPVVRPRSPARNSSHHDAETQEQEFDPDEDMLSSSPPEIPISTPAVRRPMKDGRGSSARRPQSSSGLQPVTSILHVPPGFKKRRLNRSLTQAATPLHRSLQNVNGSNDDIFAFPKSPPESSSPVGVSANSAPRRLARPLMSAPAQDLPTPSQSSSLQGDAQARLDSDLESTVRSVRRYTEQRHRPIRILSDSPSTSSEPSGGESEPSEKELKFLRKATKFVLPASHVRLDREARVRQRAHITVSPESFEPQRGIAQRVMKRRGGSRSTAGPESLQKNVVVISDESDYELGSLVLPALDVQQSAQAAADLAATFDQLYADDDSDNMENDRLELFTLGGQSRKRKKQTKLTDVFTKSKKHKTGGGTEARGNALAHASGKKMRSTSRRAGRTPPPALSVLDFDQSPDGQQRAPQFLRIAKRQARQRSDYARERPTNKHIRLHTRRDTEDANATLLQWRSGVLKPKKNLGRPRKRSEARGPLTDINHNQQRSQPQPDAEKDIDAESHQESRRGPETPQMRRKRRLPSGLSAFRRSPASFKEVLAQDPALTTSTSKQRRIIHRKAHPFRTAQLEGLETQYGRGDRSMAFQQGLREVDRQFNLQPSLPSPSRNPQLARFLADPDAVPPPFPSAKHVGDRDKAPLTKKPSVLRRRLVRKTQAQRIDVDTRDYRQPSEPALADLFIETLLPQDAKPIQVEAQEHLTLRGLGPYGTRYPTTFDVSPLKSDTYFHSSTLIGGMELHQALAGGGVAKNLDEAAGYFTISQNAKTIRCGPWNDEISSLITDLVTTIWHPLHNPSWTGSDRTKLAGSILQDSSKLLRSLTIYFSTQLSFLDPIDRQGFATNMKQIEESLFSQMLTTNMMSITQDIAPAVQLESIRTMTYLLLITMQTRQIAQHPAVDVCNEQELANLMKRIANVIVSRLLCYIPQLNDFLERNKRFAERENGIQNSEILVESVVVCMHVLAASNIPGAIFWDVVSQVLASRVDSATDLKTLESLWGTLFTLLPFIEIDDSGIIDNRRRMSFQHDNWVLVRGLLKRLFILYPQTYRVHSSSLNDYVRATLARCHHLVRFWHWDRCDNMLYAVYDFFVNKNGLKNLRREESNDSVRFLENFTDKHLLDVAPNDSSFHIFLKCLALALQSMKDTYHEKRFRSVISRLIPNHSRSYPKDQPMETESRDALRNHHDLLCTLYYASPPSCRPKLDLLRDLVHHEISHREACRLNARAWARLAAFQLSTHEPYTSARPLSEWYKEINTQTLKQYHVAKTEAEAVFKSGDLPKTDASSLIVRQAMEKNQEQFIATLRDCIAGMQSAMETAVNQHLLRGFLMESGLVELLKLPHFEDARLVVVIRDILRVLRKYASMPNQNPSSETSQRSTEESQDLYGGESIDVELLYALEQEQPEAEPKQTPLDFIQTPLWNLLSNAFGAGRAPDDNLLMDCVDTWALIAGHQVSSGARSWSYYINSHGSVAWQQLRQTEQTQKFGPYFMAALITYDPSAYTDHCFDFFNALLLSLADREAMLRFQHRLLQALCRIAPEDPLMRNLPFFKDDKSGELDITADTLRSRRLALISSLLANMRDNFHRTIHRDPDNVTELRENYSVILLGFMAAMKSNYQQLRQETVVTGAYVEFVQKIVQFLQQYTADICPVLDFFTNSAAFPLPVTDPTYVVGRLCGYASKLGGPGVPKQLSVFIQTVAQQAAAGNQQQYLVNQLTTALCADESPSKDRAALRNALLQGVFPTYIEAAFGSVIGFAIAKPILQSLRSILQTASFDVRVVEESNVQLIHDTILSISHAFIRSIEQLKSEAILIRQPHVLQATALMLDAMIPAASLLDYMYGRCSTSATKPAVISCLEHFTIFITEVLHDSVPQDIPFYDGDAHVSHCPHTGLSTFCADGLATSITTNWSANDGCIFFGQGHAKRDVVVDLGSVEEEKARLFNAIKAFGAAVTFVYGDRYMDGRKDQERRVIGDVDV